MKAMIEDLIVEEGSVSGSPPMLSPISLISPIIGYRISVTASGVQYTGRITEVDPSGRSLTLSNVHHFGGPDKYPKGAVGARKIYFEYIESAWAFVSGPRQQRTSVKYVFIQHHAWIYHIQYN